VLFQGLLLLLDCLLEFLVLRTGFSKRGGELRTLPLDLLFLKDQCLVKLDKVFLLIEVLSQLDLYGLTLGKLLVCESCHLSRLLGQHADDRVLDALSDAASSLEG
jgi:hypothetical protein